ncbi:Uncharacterized protein conserved in bacteria [Neisseria animaloris]|uniref:DUF484 family protein n=1 Tax=Neisseria animaloris TaxID=326522 RepID=UPI000A192FB6|nr:DUF484 family protein [Neisseria animaloris]OSI08320.1 hypothetical protein BWD08_03600 [Neisseria animaloris]VEH86700.1 Uncharacterized protein conserved in bacteria [Neisseria animaloris]
MDKESILEFLKAHPDFLAEHADKLGIRLRDEKIRSFAQAQLVASQLKINKMADQLENMLTDSEANKVTIERLLALDLQLLKANTIGQLVQALYQVLKDGFGISQFKLALVAEPKNKARIPEEILVAGHKARSEIAALKKPVLGNKISKEMRNLLPQSEIVPESFLQLPVPIGNKTGAVLLAADTDVNRFAEGLETEWIERMAEAIGTALSRIMGYR